MEKIKVETPDRHTQYVSGIGRVPRAPRSQTTGFNFDTRFSIPNRCFERQLRGRDLYIERSYSRQSYDAQDSITIKTEPSEASSTPQQLPGPWTRPLQEALARREPPIADRAGTVRQEVRDRATRIRGARDRSASPSRSPPRRAGSSELFFSEPKANITSDVQLAAPLSPVSIPSDRDDNQNTNRVDSVVDLTNSSSKSPSPIPIVVPEPTAACQCPVSLACPRRTNELLDCRVLEAPWRYWTLLPIDPSSWVSLDTGDDAPIIEGSRLLDVVKYIDHIKNTPKNDVTLQQSFLNLRDWIKDANSHDITTDVLRETEILPPMEKFLSTINASQLKHKKMPTWMTEDLTYLYRKWSKGDLQCDPNRGLRCVQKATSNGNLITRYLLDKSWLYFRDARYHGEGTSNQRLFNGQHWFSRIQMCRDGAHAEVQAGISGTRKVGAYSLVLSSDSRENRVGYANVDLGTVIWYQGTSLRVIEGMEGKISPNNYRDDEENDPYPRQGGPRPTDDTLVLMRSIETKKPVRVFRGFRLATTVTNKPRVGYRYDGLYHVVEKLLQKKDRQIWTFKLVRLKGQGPLRGFGTDEAREFALERRLNGQQNMKGEARYTQPRPRKVSEYL